MIIPELPAYLAAMGGEKYMGWIIALFTLTAGLSRPFSGKLTDTVGRVPAMVIGSSVCFLAGLLYPWTSTVTAFLLLRVFHGFSTGFKPTGTSAFVADLSPSGKRGEALGVQGFFASIGMASGPVLGSYLAARFSVNAMFYISSLFALLSVCVISGMKETLKERVKLDLTVFRLKKSDFVEPSVLPAAIVIFLNVFAFGVILTIIPDFSNSLGIANKGIFFAIFTLTSLLVRILGGRASDRIGRIPVLMISALLISVALVLLGVSDDRTVFFTAAAVYGLGLGINTPTAFAWTIDLVKEKIRGRGLATSYIAMEAGIGLGALFSGYMYGGDPSRFLTVFLLSAVIPFISLIFLLIYFAGYRKPSPVPDGDDKDRIGNIY